MQQKLLIIFLFTSTLCFSQTKEEQLRYKAAFDELLAMLNGEQPYSFKRAVYLSENAYYKGKWNYQEYCDEINQICDYIKKTIRERGLQNYKTAGNWGAYHYMFEPNEMNNEVTYTYNYDDFLSKKDWTSRFVRKLMQTKKGNCVSLPYFYKILCEELGYHAYLAQAPMHFYITHQDEGGKWVNLEATSGSFSRSSFIMESFEITAEQIASKIYMMPLNNKETISICISDLMRNYKHEFGTDILMLSMVENTLAYVPNNFHLLIFQGDCYYDMAKREYQSQDRDNYLVKLYEEKCKAADKKIATLHYKNVSPEWYKNKIVSAVTTDKELSDRMLEDRIRWANERKQQLNNTK
jgi:hypothetical protein